MSAFKEGGAIALRFIKDIKTGYEYESADAFAYHLVLSLKGIDKDNEEDFAKGFLNEIADAISKEKTASNP